MDFDHRDSESLQKEKWTWNYENYSSRNMMQSMGLEMGSIVPNPFNCPFTPFSFSNLVTCVHYAGISRAVRSSPAVVTHT